MANERTYAGIVIPQLPSIDADGRSLTGGQARTFQAMELATKLGRMRRMRPEECFDEALTALRSLDKEAYTIVRSSKWARLPYNN